MLKEDENMSTRLVENKVAAESLGRSPRRHVHRFDVSVPFGHGFSGNGVASQIVTMLSCQALIRR
jgi:hypothetical protein